MTTLNCELYFHIFTKPKIDINTSQKYRLFQISITPITINTQSLRKPRIPCDNSQRWSILSYFHETKIIYKYFTVIRAFQVSITPIIINAQSLRKPRIFCDDSQVSYIVSYFHETKNIKKLLYLHIMFKYTLIFSRNQSYIYIYI